MKKSLLLISTFLVIIAVVSSCSKQNNSNSGGSWIFKSQTFTAPFCSYVLGALTASTETNNPSGSIAFYFYDSTSNSYVQHHLGTTRPNFTFPPKLSSYKVTNVFPPDSGYVYIQLTDTAVYNYYQVTPNSNTIVTIQIKDTATKFLTVTLPPTEMINYNNFGSGVPSNTDSSLVSGTIIQTQ